MRFDRDIIEQINKERDVLKVEEIIRKKVLNSVIDPLRFDELNIKETSLYVRKFIHKEFHDVYFNIFVSSMVYPPNLKALSKNPITPIKAILTYESMRRKSEDMNNGKVYDLFSVHHNIKDNVRNSSWTNTLVKRGIEDLLIRHIYKNKKKWSFFNEKDDTTWLSFEYMGRKQFAEYRFGPSLFKDLGKTIETNPLLNNYDFLSKNVSLFKEDAIRSTVMAMDVLYSENVLLGTASVLQNRLKEIESI